MTFQLAQCLCPARHCILAALGECDPNDAIAELKAAIERAVPQTLNPWCGICRAPRSSWSFECGSFEAASVEDALLRVKVEEIRNLQTAEAFKAEQKASRN